MGFYGVSTRDKDDVERMIGALWGLDCYDRVSGFSDVVKTGDEGDFIWRTCVYGRRSLVRDSKGHE